MENAADALKMAGAVLLFVLAISIAIFYFGQVRQTADVILNQKDKEAKYVYYETEAGKYERNVNLETIVPSIFRSYLENYKIVFENLPSPIYKIKNKNGELIDKRTIDLETNQNTDNPNVVLANNDQKAEFIRGVLYHDFTTNQSDFQKKFHVDLTGCKSLYEQLEKATSITEYLGVYYQNDDPNQPDLNKTEKRVITYKYNS